MLWRKTNRPDKRLFKNGPALRKWIINHTFGLMVCFSHPLSGLFINNPKAAAIVSQYFTIVGIGYVLNTITNCFLGAVNGIGKPAKSMLCMVLYYMIIRMPLAWLLSRTGFGLTGIWISVFISHMIAAITAAILFFLLDCSIHDIDK